MKHDDASWHYGGDHFPEELPHEAGATHIAMFVAWCVLNGLAGDLHTEEFADDLESLRTRELTPGAWFLMVCDGKFTDEDVNEEGNAFAQAYYDAAKAGQYIFDYETVLGDSVPSLYHVPDTWDAYDRLAPVLKTRLEEWR